jgi:hypothetical protein
MEAIKLELVWAFNFSCHQRIESHSEKLEKPVRMRYDILKMEIEPLKAQIEAAFADVAYPGDHDLTSSTYGEEPEALKREFKGKRDWRELDAKFLDQAPEGWRTALSFFSHRAFVFYLPAYMLADLQNGLLEVTVEFFLFYGLTSETANEKIAELWGGGTTGQAAQRKYDQFDAQQVAAIVAYLRWKLERQADEDILQALEGYWLARTGT